MSLNNKMENILQVKNDLEKKLVREGLTINEMNLLNEVKNNISEAPIDYSDVGGARMNPQLQRSVEGGETPYSKMGISNDLIELLSSESFKDSVEKVKRAMGDDTPVEGNPQQVYMQLMGTAMGSLQDIIGRQSRHKKEIEKMAIDLVAEHFGLNSPRYKNVLKLKAELISGPRGMVQGMRTKPEQFSRDEVVKAFKNADKHKEELEKFAQEFEEMGVEFDWEKGEEIVAKKMEDVAMKEFEGQKNKRRLVNSLVQGAAFNLGHLFTKLNDKIDDLDPELNDLYKVSQATMEHLYWVYPNIEQMASSGQGQLGQVSIDEPETENGPYIINARAATLPLLIHELMKGVFQFMVWDSLPEDEKQAGMVLGAEDTLPGEVWDSLLGKAFYKRLLQIMPAEFNNFVSKDAESQNIIQLYLINKISLLSPDDLKMLMEGLIRNSQNAVEFVNRLAMGAKEQVEKLRQIPVKDEPEQPKQNDDEGEDDMSWLDDYDDED